METEDDIVTRTHDITVTYKFGSCRTNFLGIINGMFGLKCDTIGQITYDEENNKISKFYTITKTQ